MGTTTDTTSQMSIILPSDDGTVPAPPLASVNANNWDFMGLIRTHIPPHCIYHCLGSPLIQSQLLYKFILRTTGTATPRVHEILTNEMFDW